VFCGVSECTQPVDRILGFGDVLDAAIDQRVGDEFALNATVINDEKGEVFETVIGRVGRGHFFV